MGRESKEDKKKDGKEKAKKEEDFGPLLLDIQRIFDRPEPSTKNGPFQDPSVWSPSNSSR